MSGILNNSENKKNIKKKLLKKPNLLEYFIPFIVVNIKFNNSIHLKYQFNDHFNFKKIQKLTKKKRLKFNVKQNFGPNACTI